MSSAVELINQRLCRLRTETAFTLAELLVVILIVALLASIALPNFLGQINKGRDADAKSTATNAAHNALSIKASSMNQDWSGSDVDSTDKLASVMSGDEYTVHSDAAAIGDHNDVGIERVSGVIVSVTTRSGSGRYFCKLLRSDGVSTYGYAENLADCKTAALANGGWRTGQAGNGGSGCAVGGTATDDATKAQLRSAYDIVKAVATTGSYPYMFADPDYDSIPEIDSLLEAQTGKNVITVNQFPDFGAATSSDLPGGPNNLGMIFFLSMSGQAEFTGVMVSPSSHTAFLYTAQQTGVAIPCDAVDSSDFFLWS